LTGGVLDHVFVDHQVVGHTGGGGLLDDDQERELAAVAIDDLICSFCCCADADRRRRLQAESFFNWVSGSAGGGAIERAPARAIISRWRPP
jgi:hypothetical protein